jgi:hypothetical protein
MKLKARVKSLLEVPEVVRAFYCVQGSEFVLQVDGMVAKDRLDEMRNSNIALRRQIEQMGGKPCSALGYFNGA